MDNKIFNYNINSAKETIMDIVEGLRHTDCFDSFFLGDIEENVSKESQALRIASKTLLLETMNKFDERGFLTNFFWYCEEGLFYEIIGDTWYLESTLINDVWLWFILNNQKHLPLSLIYIDDNGNKWLSYRLLEILFDLRNELKFFYRNKSNKKSIPQTKTYLMVDDNTGYVKIGKSFNPREREKTLQSEKPTISLLAVCHKNIESNLHKQYAIKRVRGEWFNLTKSQIKSIIELHGFIFVKNKLFN